MIPDITTPTPYMAEMRKRLVETQQSAKQDYNVAARDLPKLSLGARVRIQDHVSKKFSIRGTIEKVLGDRDYLVKHYVVFTMCTNRRGGGNEYSGNITPSSPHRRRSAARR